VYVAGKKVFSEDYLKQLTPLSLAIWYMDDGCFTLRSKGLQQRTTGGSGRIEIVVEAMSPDTRVRLRDYLADTWEIDANLLSRGAEGKAVLQFPTVETTKFQALVAPFVHPSMDYKLLPRFRGRFAVEPSFAEPRLELMPFPIKQIVPYHPGSAPRSSHRYDIEVEGSHNYFAGGVMVHNSPETTPGGRALKFYSSVRLDIRRIESIKDGAEVVGNRTRVKVVKNKVSAPYRQAEFDIMYAKGISREGSLLDMAVDMGIVKKSGAWFTYEGEQLGQGRENAKAFLTGNPEIMVEISDKVLTQAGLRPGREEEPGASNGEFTPDDDAPIELD
jgi:recombination protein RecA